MTKLVGQNVQQTENLRLGVLNARSICNKAEELKNMGCVAQQEPGFI